MRINLNNVTYNASKPLSLAQTVGPNAAQVKPTLSELTI